MCEADGALLFSRFKYRLQNVSAELCILRSKEDSARAEIEATMQKLRNLEADQAKQKALIQAQLSEANDARHKLEGTVKLMGLESAALEDKVKNLSLELKKVIDSRSTLAEELKVTNYDLACKLRKTTSQLVLAAEKIRRQTMLFDAAEKEAGAIKEVLEETRKLVTSRGGTVLELQQRVKWTNENDQKLIDRARSLESELRNKQATVSLKDKEIIALKVALEAARSETLREPVAITNLEIKEAMVSQLTEEKQELLREAERLKRFIEKLQEAASHQDSVLETLRRSLVEYKEEAEKANDRIGSLEQHEHDMQILEREKKKLKQENTELELKNRELELKYEQLEKRPFQVHASISTTGTTPNDVTACIRPVGLYDETTATDDLEAWIEENGKLELKVNSPESHVDTSISTSGCLHGAQNEKHFSNRELGLEVDHLESKRSRADDLPEAQDGTISIDDPADEAPSKRARS